MMINIELHLQTGAGNLNLFSQLAIFHVHCTIIAIIIFAVQSLRSDCLLREVTLPPTSVSSILDDSMYVAIYRVDVSISATELGEMGLLSQ